MKQINLLLLIAWTIPITLPQLGLQAQGLHLTPGINWMVNGSPSLVLNNASLVNDGSFSADSGTVLFTGNAISPGSSIGGHNPIFFYNLTVGKSANDVELNSNVFVTGRITLDSGNLQLNDYMLDLGNTGSIAGERNEARITGSQGGTIRITAQLNRPRAVNPGNIGVELTSEADLGSTVITRGHTPLINSGGQTSIQRWFDINQEANTNALVSLRFFYLDRELAGNDKQVLSVLSAREGDDHWSLCGKDASDPVAKWVFKRNIDQSHRFTLTIGSGKVLSKPGPGGTTPSFKTYPNPAHEAFALQLISGEEGSGVIHLYDQSGNLLEEKAANWQAGVNTINWDISRYAKGVYYLSIGGSNGSAIKIVRQ